MRTSGRIAAPDGARFSDDEGRRRRRAGPRSARSTATASSRVAAASPRASTGDVAFNVDRDAEAGAGGRQAGRRPRRLPRAQPLLLCDRRSAAAGRLPRRGRGRDRAGSPRRARSSGPCWSSARRCGATAGSTIAALAIARGRILGAVPKSFLPNYREYYEKRWFASGVGLDGLKMELAGQSVPFGTDLIFAADDLADFVFHIEICEDYWAPQPPSTARRAGRRADPHQPLRLQHHDRQGGRAQIALRQPGQPLHRRLRLLRLRAGREHHRPRLGRPGLDLRARRTARRDRPVRLGARSWRSPISTSSASGSSGCATARSTTMPAPPAIPRRASAGSASTHAARHSPTSASSGSCAASPTSPTGPSSSIRIATRRSTSRSRASRRRFQATSGKHLVIGVSGGLDSTHALIVAAKACDDLGLPRSTILGFTMPGFATGEETKGNAWSLMNALGIAGEEIDIRPAARQMLADMGHPVRQGRAGLRRHLRERAGGPSHRLSVPPRQPARRLRRRHRRPVARSRLGWSTYGVGDQMSHYGVNAGVPKTLIQYLIRWAIRSDQFDEADQPRPPGDPRHQDLARAGPGRRARAAMQSTEDRIGPYELHDFFLYHILRHGQPPSKVAFLAWQAWKDAEGRALAARLSRGAQARIRPRHDPQMARGLPASASSSSASTSAAPCPIRPRSRPAAPSARAATGARRATAMPRRGWRN